MAEPSVIPKEHRTRLLEGMARAVANKGYAQTTIADVVGEAGVSRRTFYEHFAGKDDCLIALYEAASHNALKVLRSAIDPGQQWGGQVEQALGAYLGGMAGNPALLRTLFVEILGLGPAGLAARRRIHHEIADFMLVVVRQNPGADPGRPLSRPLALAVVGGIHELVLDYIERDQADRLAELVAPAAELVHAVLGA